MGLAVAVAAGLNPYVTLFLIAALALWTPRLDPSLPGMGPVPSPWLLTAVIGSGVALLLDLVFGKLAKRVERRQQRTKDIAIPGWISPAGLARRVGALVAPLVGGMLAVSLAAPEMPVLLAWGSGAVLAGATGVMLTIIADRARRSPAWVGMGHIPVLIAATTGGAIIIPLATVVPWLGLSIALVGVGVLVAGVLAGRRKTAPRFTAPVYHTVRRSASLARVSRPAAVTRSSR